MGQRLDLLIACVEGDDDDSFIRILESKSLSIITAWKTLKLKFETTRLSELAYEMTLRKKEFSWTFDSKKELIVPRVASSEAGSSKKDKVYFPAHVDILPLHKRKRVEDIKPRLDQVEGVEAVSVLTIKENFGFNTKDSFEERDGDDDEEGELDGGEREDGDAINFEKDKEIVVVDELTAAHNVHIYCKDKKITSFFYEFGELFSPVVKVNTLLSLSFCHLWTKRLPFLPQSIKYQDTTIERHGYFWINGNINLLVVNCENDEQINLPFSDLCSRLDDHCFPDESLLLGFLQYLKKCSSRRTISSDGLDIGTETVCDFKHLGHVLTSSVNITSLRMLLHSAATNGIVVSTKEVDISFSSCNFALLQLLLSHFTNVIANKCDLSLEDLDLTCGGFFTNLCCESLLLQSNCSLLNNKNKYFEFCTLIFASSNSMLSFVDFSGCCSTLRDFRILLEGLVNGLNTAGRLPSFPTVSVRIDGVPPCLHSDFSNAFSSLTNVKFLSDTY